MILNLKNRRLEKIAAAVLTLIFLVSGLQFNGNLTKNAEASHTGNWSSFSGVTATSVIQAGSIIHGTLNDIRDDNTNTWYGVQNSTLESNSAFYALINLNPNDGVYPNLTKIEAVVRDLGNGLTSWTLEIKQSGIWTTIGSGQVGCCAISTISINGSGVTQTWTNVSDVRIHLDGMPQPNNGGGTALYELRAYGPFRHSMTMINSASTGAGGTITSTPAGINCPSNTTCTHYFNNDYTSGNLVTFTATPNNISNFSGWTGACAGYGTKPCSLLMTSDWSVSGQFSLQTRTLTLKKTGDGLGAVTASPGSTCDPICSASYSYNTQVDLTAAPGANSTFTGWSEDCTGTANPCAVTMNVARNVTATFMTNKTLTVRKNGPSPADVTISDISQGLIDCGATCSASYTHNSSITLSATEGPFTQFDGWSGAGCTGTGNCIVTMNAARTVTANFSLLPQPLTITPTGLGLGTITSSPAGIDCGPTTFDCSADFGFGTIVALTATPDADSQFIQWSGDCTGVGSGGSNPGTCSVVLDQPRDATAEFEAKITDTSNPDLSGWAWSSQIGWLSFNCINTNNCATSDYRVEMNPTTGILNGWAWSPVVGWVEFNAAGPYPENPQTCTTIDVNTGVASGWARSLSYQNAQIIGFERQQRQQDFAVNENNAGQAAINSGGFESLINFFKNIFNQNFNLINPDKIFAQTAGIGDGWLKITNAQRKNDELIGWAWGGEPIGWLSFNCLNSPSGCGQSNYKVKMPSPSCSFTSDKKNVSPTESVTLTWACDFPVSCSLNEGIGAVDPISGSTVNQPSKNVTVYQLTCTGLGTTRSWSVEVKKFESPRKEIRPR